MPALASRPSSSAARKLSGGSNSGSERHNSFEGSGQNKRGTQQKTATTSQTQKVAGQNGRARDRSREKPPSKDGAAQRAAGEVAGLKDYVGPVFSNRLVLVNGRIGLAVESWAFLVREGENLERGSEVALSD